MKLSGTVHKYGANVDTDVIIPARYLTIPEVQEMATHCMEDLDAEFVHKVQPGDIIVAETNFGSGSSREWAAIVIKACGVGCIIAKSFSRIFYRNAINIGLPILESVEAVDGIEKGHLVEVDLIRGEIVNATRHSRFQAKAYPEFMLELILAGGLVNDVRRRLEKEKARDAG